MDDEHPGIRQAAWMAQEGHGLLVALEARFDRLPHPLDWAQLLRWHHLWGGEGAVVSTCMLPHPLDRAQLLRWHHLWGGEGAVVSTCMLSGTTFARAGRSPMRSAISVRQSHSTLV